MTPTTQNIKPTSPTLLTVEDIAQMLQVSVRSIWRMRSTNAIPKPIKISGSIRWRREDIEQWIAQGCPKQN